MRNFYARYLPIIWALSFAPAVMGQNLLDPRVQPKFVNPLPIPSVIDARSGGTLNISISQFEQNLGLVNPATGQPMFTKVWGYNGSYPGPTIVAKKDVPLSVYWHNNLVNSSNQPLPHLLPIDPSVHWALEGLPGWQTRGVPIVTHLHGGHTESASDGLPEAWYTPGFALKGRDFIKGDVLPYYYSNDQEAATLWYHDHGLGITRLNVYAGLAGYYILTDNQEISLQNNHQLPAAPYDIGLAIQDRMFTANGQLFLPSTEDDDDEEESSTPTVLPEFFGDFILVNGKTWPVLEVEPRIYRFRILNGSDSRYYDLHLTSGQVFTQIGSDNGLLPSPVPFSQLLVGTGERRDVVIDFSDPALWGRTIIMKNNAKTPFPKGSSVDPQTTGMIMAFKVTKPLNTAYPATIIPATLRPPIAPLQTTLPARQLILFEAEDEYGRLKPMLGTAEAGVLGWHESITENPAMDNTEIWEFYNETVDAHTIHLHLVHMQLISRQKFMASVNEENGKPSRIRLLGNPRGPGPEEAGWKDTYIMYPGEVTRVIAQFDKEGLYVWHCHILSHEDHEMMRPFFVGDMNQGGMTTQAKPADAAFEQTLQLRVLPNPFNSNLHIRFQLKKPGNVVINIYDAGGKLLQKVYKGSRGEGNQDFSIDGSNWSNGQYFAEIIIGDQRIVRKLMLQK